MDLTDPDLEHWLSKKKSSNSQNCIDKYLYDKMSTVILQLEKNERVSASGAWLVKKEKVQ
jgi:hypothetical protein